VFQLIYKNDLIWYKVKYMFN